MPFNTDRAFASPHFEGEGDEGPISGPELFQYFFNHGGVSKEVFTSLIHTLHGAWVLNRTMRKELNDQRASIKAMKMRIDELESLVLRIRSSLRDGRPL